MALLKVLLLSFSFAFTAKTSGPIYKKISIGPYVLKKVELANTPEKRERGMMFRKKWGDVEAMLFDFYQADSRRSFWMKNTLLDLSIAFFDQDGVLLEHAELKATKSILQKADRILSKEKARYVLELPKGWFARHKVTVGARLKVL